MRSGLVQPESGPKLIRRLTRGLSPNDKAQVMDAYNFAKPLRGKERFDGTDMLDHSVRAALNIKNSYDVRHAIPLVGSILHDYSEDMIKIGGRDEQYYLDMIKERFPFDVYYTALIDTKWEKWKEEQGMAGSEMDHYLTQLLESVSRTILPQFIKCAGDNTDNMRTLGFMPRHKITENALEGIRVYSNLALAISLGKAERELKEIGLRWFNATLFKQWSEVLRVSKIKWGDNYYGIAEGLRAMLALYNIDGRVFVEERTVSETLEVVTNPEKKYARFEAFRLRVEVEDKSNCIIIPGLLHRVLNDLHPASIIKGETDCRIGTPYPNGYQAAFSRFDVPGKGLLYMKVQTPAMYQWGEFGPLSIYHRDKMRTDWYRDTALLRQFEDCVDARPSRPMVDVVEGLANTVIVHSPAGGAFSLAGDAIWLDYAYRIHQKLGRQAKSVKILRLPDGSVPEGEEAIKSIYDRVIPGSQALVKENGDPRRPSDYFRVRLRAATEDIKAYIKSLNPVVRVAYGEEELAEIFAGFSITKEQVMGDRVHEIMMLLFKEKFGGTFDLTPTGMVGVEEYEVNNIDHLRMLLGSGRVDPEDIKRCLAEAISERISALPKKTSYLEVIVGGEMRDLDPIEVPVSLLRRRMNSYIVDKDKRIPPNGLVYFKNIKTYDLPDGSKMIRLELEYNDSLQLRQIQNIFDSEDRISGIVSYSSKPDGWEA